MTETGSPTPSPEERQGIAERLAKVEPYGKPRQVWVDDGHVFVEGYDGTVVSMTPEVAIELGRLISNAGADSLVNQVMDKDSGEEAILPPPTS
jgi:hypothetical protein